MGSLRVDHRRRDLAAQHAAVWRGAGRVEQLDEQLYRRAGHAGYARGDYVWDVYSVWATDVFGRGVHLVLGARDEAVDARGDGEFMPTPWQ